MPVADDDTFGDFAGDALQTPAQPVSTAPNLTPTITLDDLDLGGGLGSGTAPQQPVKDDLGFGDFNGGAQPADDGFGDFNGGAQPAVEDDGFGDFNGGAQSTGKGDMGFGNISAGSAPPAPVEDDGFGDFDGGAQPTSDGFGDFDDGAAPAAANQDGFGDFDDSPAAQQATSLEDKAPEAAPPNQASLIDDMLGAAMRGESIAAKKPSARVGPLPGSTPAAPTTPHAGPVFVDNSSMNSKLSVFDAMAVSFASDCV